ncbi:MAG: DUF4126 family protein [Anaerolineales bacterium]
MSLVLSAIAAGGLVGASNQYACLLVVSIAARLGWVELAGPMQFMGEWWFMGLVGLMWLVTVAPSFAQQFAPGLMHAVNAFVHFVSGFVVPASSALIALAAAGVIANLSPELKAALETLRIFTGEGSLGGNGALIAGGGAAVAVALTSMKAVAKPMIATGSGTAGAVSAPAFVIAENAASVVLMGLAYALSQIDPWLLVALLGVVIVISLGLLLFGLYQLWRLKRGLGRLLVMLQVNPRAGLAVCVEFFVWGLGWLVWKHTGRGAVSLLLWVVWLAFFISVQPIVVGMFALLPPLIPLALISANAFMLMLFALFGLNSARALLKTLERETPIPSAPTAATA